MNIIHECCAGFKRFFSACARIYMIQPHRAALSRYAAKETVMAWGSLFTPAAVKYTVIV